MHRSVDGRGSGPASRVEDVALLACLWLVLGFTSTATLATIASAGPVPLIPTQTWIVAAFLVSLLPSVGVVGWFRRRLYALCYRPAAAGDSIWADVTLYCVVYLVLQYGGSILLIPFFLPLGALFGDEFVARLFLLACAVVGLLVVRGCRSGRFSVPDSIRSKPWGLTEYAGLFACVALVAYSYGEPLFSVAGGPGRPALAAVVGALAVALRALGVFVPAPPSTPEQGEHRVLR